MEIYRLAIVFRNDLSILKKHKICYRTPLAINIIPFDFTFDPGLRIFFEKSLYVDFVSVPFYSQGS